MATSQTTLKPHANLSGPSSGRYRSGWGSPHFRSLLVRDVRTVLQPNPRIHRVVHSGGHAVRKGASGRQSVVIPVRRAVGKPDCRNLQHVRCA
jgi:hypothetical protein